MLPLAEISVEGPARSGAGIGLPVPRSVMSIVIDDSFLTRQLPSFLHQSAALERG